MMHIKIIRSISLKISRRFFDLKSSSTRQGFMKGPFDVEVHVKALAGGDDVIVVHHEQTEGVGLQVEAAGGGEGLPGDHGGIPPDVAVGGADDGEGAHDSTLTETTTCSPRMPHHHHGSSRPAAGQSVAVQHL
ncbi:hypothetical protein [Corynebacterium efficiens YS-314]|uniref:Uncharacterized protein n=1 Tax=Corynebacterium efficiens (strain DSM 44549 / YS-314 / AJ 12310 / JCM 11189 / NBRC 100395) TaxID=196164 RepID=Q8FQ84_COREF|nr:hypothetical protein [Corynebacterium efficiens YS-314]